VFGGVWLIVLSLFFIAIAKQNLLVWIWGGGTACQRNSPGFCFAAAMVRQHSLGGSAQSGTAVKEQGATVVMVMHELTLVFRYVTHLIEMKGGGINAQGSLLDIVTEELLKEVYQIDCRSRN
jgi:hypothetical protein